MRRLLTATALVLASGTLAQAEGTLQLFNWGNYTSPEMLAKFEAETGIKVTVTDYDSNDAALAKIEAGGHGFDLVVPTHQYVPIFVEKGLIVPLDLSKIPNRGNIAPEWQNVSWDPGRAHTIPWQWGTTGIAVDTAVYGGDINTSDVFLNVPPELVGQDQRRARNERHREPRRDVGGRFALQRGHCRPEKGPRCAAGGQAEPDCDGLWRFQGRLSGPEGAGCPAEGRPERRGSLDIPEPHRPAGKRGPDFRVCAPGQWHCRIRRIHARRQKAAPEVVIPEACRAAGVFIPTCGPRAQEFMTAIWSELQKWMAPPLWGGTRRGACPPQPPRVFVPR